MRIAATIVVALAIAACGPPPPPPEAARPPPCPGFDPAEARQQLRQAQAWLEPGPGRDLGAAFELYDGVRRCRPEHGDLPAMEEALTQAAVEEAEALEAAGHYDQACFLLARLAGPLDLGDELRDAELRWAMSLGDHAVQDERAGRWASAWVRSAVAASLGARPGDREARDRAAVRFSEDAELGVFLQVELLPELEGTLEPRLERDPSPALRWLADADLAELQGQLVVGPMECDEEIVRSVASRPARDAQRASLLKRREAVESELAEAEAALAAAAAEQRRLRRLALALEEPSAGALEAARAEPLTARVLEAREALEALPTAQPPVEPFRYELRTGTLSCRLGAELEIGSGVVRQLEPVASCSDSAHPAFLDQDLDEDPLRYAQSRAELRDRVLDALVQQLVEALEGAAAERCRQQLAELGEGVLTDVEIERGLRAALLLRSLHPDEGDQALQGLVDRHLGQVDPEALPALERPPS